MIICARFETRYFEFRAYGTGYAGAYNTLEKAWARHCEQFEDADPCLLEDNREDVMYSKVSGDIAYRDGELLEIGS